MKQNSAMTLIRYGEALKEIGVQQRVSYVVMIILLALTAWIGGQLIWQPWSTSSIELWQPSGIASVSSDNTSQIDISAVQNSHLFGKYQASAPVVVQPKVQDAPKSRLNVVLVGVVTSSNPQKSLAVIANRGQQSTYGIEEVIEGTRARLVQVQSDRVIIDNSGRNETVMLEGLKYTKPSPSQSSNNKSVTRTQVPTDTLEKIREEIRQDAKQVFQYVRMSQVKQGDEVAGYRLSPGKDKALFDAVGLKPGDIAISINGLDLKDTATMAEVFRDLSQLTELNLTVERNGQPHEIYIEL